MSLVVSAAFGGILVSPGTLYPRSRSYRYRDELGRIGPMLFAGVLGLVLASAVVQYLLETGTDFGVFRLAAVLFLLATRFFLVFEHLLVFFPFTAFAGKHIMNWSRIAWLVLALPIVALFVLNFL